MNIRDVFWHLFNQSVGGENHRKGEQEHLPFHIMMEIGFRFSACVSYASGMWVSYGPYMTRIGRWLNPSIMSC